MKETLEQLMKEELEKIEESMKKLKGLAKKSGTPMTLEECEDSKKKRGQNFLIHKRNKQDVS